MQQDICNCQLVCVGGSRSVGRSVGRFRHLERVPTERHRANYKAHSLAMIYQYSGVYDSDTTAAVSPPIGKVSEFVVPHADALLDKVVFVRVHLRLQPVK